MIKVDTSIKDRVSQGDIFKDVEYIQSVIENNGNIEITKIQFPLVIVLTQDCDLEQDHKFRSLNNDKHDKYLLSALVAPIYNLEHVFDGIHLEELGLKMAKIERNKTPGNNLKNNETPRYHHLKFPLDIQVVDSVIDFKHYFSVEITQLRALKQSNFVCQISELYREDISQRFSNFLSRIGLPNI